MAIRFGNIASYGIPPGKKFDHVKLPKLYISGLKNISWFMAWLIKSFPGTGLLILLNNAHFWVQNISKKPSSANTVMIGWSETKKHTKRNILIT